ncbi:MAG TPA: hypothetical protein VLM89_13075 [Phycisphaerae bacterium]|nr:hypothetical protein [Phycisphaerae bacterium]
MANFYVDNTLFFGHHAGNAQGGGNSPEAYITLTSSCGESDGAFEHHGIRITGGTGEGQERKITGYTAGDYKATVDAAWETVPDATSVYEITYGCDRNSGQSRTTGSGAAGPWRSVDKACASVGPGGTIYVKAGRAYTGANAEGAVATIRFVGIEYNPIRLLGYKETPGDADARPGDASRRAVLDGEGAATYCLATSADIEEEPVLHWEIANLVFRGATSDGCNLAPPYGQGFLRNCSAKGNGGNGFQLNGINALLDCEACDNGGHGVYGGNLSLTGCAAHGNGGWQIHMFDGMAERCTVYDFPANAGGIFAGWQSGTVDQCTVDGVNRTGTGVLLNTVCGIASNNIICRCDRGVQGKGFEIKMARNNLYWDNTYDKWNWIDDQVGGIGGDPKFVDRDGHDYRLMPDSPAIGAAVNGGDVGAYSRGTVPAGSPTCVGMQT